MEWCERPSTLRTMARQNLLLVDDDAKSLRVMEVSLRNAGYAVTTAANGAEALAKVAAARPGLIVADTEMPVLDGYELCRRLKADDQFKEIPFLFLTEEDSVEAKVKGLELGADDYLAKPIYIKEVITRVRMVLQKRERESLERKDKRRFFGSLEDMGVVDLLQTIEMGRKAGTIRFERGNQRATLWFEDGRVIDAKAGRLSGEEAVFRLLTWEEGTFEIDFRAPDVPTRIQASTQGLLMEGMRRVDEWGRMCEQLPALDTVFQVDNAELAERLAELPDEVNALLRLFDGHRTALQAIDDAALPDLDALSAISRLYFEGIIYQSTDRTPEPVEEVAPRRAEPLEDWLSEAAKVNDARTSRPPAAAPALPPRDAIEGRPSLAPKPTPLGQAVDTGVERNLVDDLLASAADIPNLDVADETGAFAIDDAVGGADAMLFEPGGPGDFEDDLVVDELGLAEPGSSLAGAALPMADDSDGRVGDHAHEQDFFDRPREEEPLLPDDLLVDEERETPTAAYIAMGIIGAIALLMIGYFALRDTVELRDVPRNALNSSWHRDQLKKRDPLGTLDPIDAGWAIPNEPDGGLPSTPETGDGGLGGEAGEADGGAVGSPEPPKPSPVPEDPAQAKSFKQLMAEGTRLHRQGKYSDAARRFESAVALSPPNQDAWLALSKSELETGALAKAKRAAMRVLQLNAKSAPAHLIVGTVAQEQGQKERAIEHYDKYLKLAPKGRYAPDVRKVLEGIR